jgi:hypothetical protein
MPWCAAPVPTPLEPGVVPIFFAIDAMPALVDMILGSCEPWAD